MQINIDTDSILFLIDLFRLHNEYAILLAEFAEEYHPGAYTSNP